MFVDCINNWAKIKSEKQYLTITWSHSAAGKPHKLGRETLIKLCGKLFGVSNVLSLCFNPINEQVFGLQDGKQKQSKTKVAASLPFFHFNVLQQFLGDTSKKLKLPPINNSHHLSHSARPVISYHVKVCIMLRHLSRWRSGSTAGHLWDTCGRTVPKPEPPFRFHHFIVTAKAGGS